jgi:ammonium transporter Rh
MIALIEVPIYAINEAIAIVDFKVADIGGSMTIHTFGAYFGLAVSYSGFSKAAKASGKSAKADKVSNLVAAIGTIFLWMYWPSFNGALGKGGQQSRAAINTALSLCVSCVTSTVLSRWIKGQFDMEVLLNSTLAGGVAVGASADLIELPYAAMLIGGVAGIISCLGYCYLTPFLQEKIGLYDTCGIHNLHGMPGILGCISSLFVVGDIGPEFGAAHIYGFGTERNRGDQVAYQVATLAVTLVLAIGGGLFTGKLVSLSIFSPPNVHMEDAEFWHDCEPGDDADHSHSARQLNFNS